MTVRALIQHELACAAQIHSLAFPDSALTKLGAEAARRYYHWLLSGPHDSVCLGAFNGSDMLGFCFGGIFRGALSGFVSQNRVFLARLVVTHPWLLANPIFRERLTLGLRVLRRNRKPKPAVLPAPSAEPRARSFGILSIAVHPERQGGGVGRLLMAESERIALERGFRDMNLSVHPTNMQAIRFYEGLGWERVTQDGVWQGQMKKRIGEQVLS
jgi:ribosomal protein S18 acetylase RimI-like enzyme